MGEKIAVAAPEVTLVRDVYGAEPVVRKAPKKYLESTPRTIKGADTPRG